MINVNDGQAPVSAKSNPSLATLAAEIVARTRAKQGLPPRISGAHLQRIATLLTGPESCGPR